MQVFIKFYKIKSFYLLNIFIPTKKKFHCNARFIKRRKIFAIFYEKFHLFKEFFRLFKEFFGTLLFFSVI